MANYVESYVLCVRHVSPFDLGAEQEQSRCLQAHHQCHTDLLLVSTLTDTRTRGCIVLLYIMYKYKTENKRGHFSHTNHLCGWSFSFDKGDYPYMCVCPWVGRHCKPLSTQSLTWAHMLRQWVIGGGRSSRGCMHARKVRCHVGAKVK